MTSLKTVLLGSAAGILAVGAAQAADLPVKKAAAAVQYVETCPVYGAGFYKLPGTDICIRHFGSVKFNFSFQNGRDFYDERDRLRIDANVANTTGWQWTIRPGWDFRSPTEFGTLRTVVQLRVDQRNGVHQDDDPVLTGAMRTTNLVHRGYIEWAGFLIGRASSQFIYWDQDDVVTAIGGDPKTTAMQFTYVWNIGNGLKFTIGAEDSTPWQAGDAFRDLTGGDCGGGGNCGGLSVDGTPTTGPQRWKYDFVASLSTEQSWGNAKISGIMHNITATSHRNCVTNDVNVIDADTGLPVEVTTTCNPADPPDFPDREGAIRGSKWGWAGLAGITFNLPMLGAKDQLLLQGTICNGAIAACGINGGAENNLTSFERNGQYIEGLQRNDVDAYAFQDGSTFRFERTKAWSIAGQLRHYWSPLWRSNLMASYSKINVPKRVENLAVDDGGQGDASRWDVGANLIWGQSRKTAEIGIEAAYKKVNREDQPGREVDDGGKRDPSGWSVSAFISRAW
jgi:hypothetical protein